VVLFGALPEGEVALREPGGTWRGRSERVFGTAQYAVGEEALVFVSRGASGELHTTGMAMGKYEICSGRGEAIAKQEFGEGVAFSEPALRQIRAGSEPDATPLRALLAAVRSAAAERGTRAAQPLRVARLRGRKSRPAASAPAFTFLGDPARRFEF